MKSRSAVLFLALAAFWQPMSACAQGARDVPSRTAGLVIHVGTTDGKLDAAPMSHEFELCRAIVVAKESLLAAIAALRDMMRQPRNNDSRDSGRGRNVRAE